MTFVTFSPQISITFPPRTGGELSVFGGQNVTNVIVQKIADSQRERAGRTPVAAAAEPSRFVDLAHRVDPGSVPATQGAAARVCGLS